MKISPPKEIRAFTLLEITLSLVLGLIVSLSAVQFYISLKKVILRQKAILDLQQSMQTSTFFMGQAIRRAGNMGCIKWQDAQKRMIPEEINLENLGLANNKVIRLTSIQELKKNPYISSNVLKNIKPNTDILWIVDSDDIASYKHPNDFMIEADCCDITLFRRSTPNDTDNRNNLKRIRKLNSVLYYINYKNELCSLALNHYSQAHIEGVHDWKITFDTDNTISIRFWFRPVDAHHLHAGYLDEHLDWEQTWFIR